MLVGIGSVDSITEEGKRCACFHCRAQDQTHNLFQRNCTFADAGIMDTIQILLFPFLSPAVFQGISFYHENFMGIHQIPVLVQVFIGHLPEQIGIAHSREDIMCFHSVIAIVCSQL